MHTTQPTHAPAEQKSAPSRPQPVAQQHAPDPATATQRALGNSYTSALGQRGTQRIRVQRTCSCGGSCPSCAAKNEEQLHVQPALTVGPVDDPFEREADQMAAHVLGMSAPAGHTAETSEPRLPIRRLAEGGETGGVEANLDLDQSTGQPLSATSRSFMEPRFGADFGQVRLHTDNAAQQAAAQIQARAFTYGSHIWLGRGESESDQRLMAHELTHVVQQSSAPSNTPADSAATPGGATIQREPQAQCPSTKTVTVDMVSINDSTRDPVDDLAFVNSVFRPCCVQFTLGRGMSVNPTLSDPWLGSDTVLDRATACGAVSGEEVALFDGVRANFSLSSRIQVYYVGAINPADRAYSIPAYCATGPAAPYVDSAVVTNTAARRSLAHEFGHILLNSGSHTGIDNPADTSNLMVPTNTATGETLDATQCATIFTNA